jgi:hypothetical protein
MLLSIGGGVVETEFVRVEIATCAQSKGNLTWDSWSHEVITALGLSGVRNPLGFSIIRYLSEPRPNKHDVYRVVLMLAVDLMQYHNLDKDTAGDIAAKSMDYWSDMRCRHCLGRGVTDFEQTQCNVCGGTGHKEIPTSSDWVKKGIEMLISAENFMENQLRKRCAKNA